MNADGVSGAQAMNRFQRIALVGAATLAFAAPAFACSIMPPPPPPMPAPGTPEADVSALNLAWGTAHNLKYGEELRAFAMRQQVRLFDEAASVVVVRYDREGKSGESTNAVLKPVRWLKGGSAPAELAIGMTQPPPCGQMIGHDAYYGKPGDVFIAYLSSERKPQVLEAYALTRIIEPRTIAALTTAP